MDRRRFIAGLIGASAAGCALTVERDNTDVGTDVACPSAPLQEPCQRVAQAPAHWLRRWVTREAYEDGFLDGHNHAILDEHDGVPISEYARTADMILVAFEPPVHNAVMIYGPCYDQSEYRPLR